MNTARLLAATKFLSHGCAQIFTDFLCNKIVHLKKIFKIRVDPCKSVIKNFASEKMLRRKFLL